MDEKARDNLRNQHVEYLERLDAGEEIPYLDFEEWCEMRVIELQGLPEKLARAEAALRPFARIGALLRMHSLAEARPEAIWYRYNDAAVTVQDFINAVDVADALDMAQGK